MTITIDFTSIWNQAKAQASAAYDFTLKTYEEMPIAETTKKVVPVQVTEACDFVQKKYDELPIASTVVSVLQKAIVAIETTFPSK